MALDPVKNFAISRVATAPSPADSGTTLVVETGDGALFPDPSSSGAYNVVIYPNGEQPTSTNAEIVRVTARTSDTMTITREQESTSARTVAEGDIVMLAITAKMVSDLSTAVTGVVTETGTQTLTNKTLTSPVLNTGVSGTAIDTDLSSVSASDDTLASAKAIKAYADAVGKNAARYDGFASGALTTTSATGVQVGSAQVSLTTKGGTVCVIGSAVLYNNSVVSWLDINIDGTMQNQASITNSTTGQRTICFCVKTGLSAGSHTIKLMFYTQSGGTAGIPSYQGYNLLAWEV